MPHDNLIPASQRTPEERREIAQKGGIASGVARRRKRALKEAADLYLSLPVRDKRVWNRLARRGIDPEDIDNQMLVIAGLTDAAACGDAKAAAVLFKALGEDVPPGEVNEDQLQEAKKLLGGIGSAIDAKTE